MADIIQFNQEEIKSQLGELVRQSVEDTLNAMLDAEADQITQAHKYERTEKRLDTRAGHYNRTLATKAGGVTLKVRNSGVFRLRVDILRLLFRLLSYSYSTVSIRIMLVFPLSPLVFPPVITTVSPA